MSNEQTLWKFHTKNFTVRLCIEDDVLSTQGMDRTLAAECREKVKSGEWTCFQSVVEVVYRPTGLVIGEEFLGGSIYASPKDFRDHFGMTAGGHGSYFFQMVQAAIVQARKRFPALQAEVASVKLKTRKSEKSAILAS